MFMTLFDCIHDRIRRGLFRRIRPVLCPCVCAAFLLVAPALQAAEMSAEDVSIRPGDVGEVEIRGSIDGESTFGWTLMVELVPRAGARGSVQFTTAPAQGTPRRARFQIRNGGGVPANVLLSEQHSAAMDIQQGDDVWPKTGSFSPFDTDRTPSPMQNGAVDDNGTLVAAAVYFDGVLARFPVRADGNARGTWEIRLVTEAGASGWEGRHTELTFGMVTVVRDACRTARDCDDRDACTIDACVGGECDYRAVDDCRKSQRSRRGR